MLCASAAYLAAHQFVALVMATGPLNEFRFRVEGKRVTHTVDLENAWETNDGALVRAWTLAGRGVARKTIWDVAQDIRSGVLWVVLPDLIEEEPGIYAVFQQNRYMPPRVRALLDFLIERFNTASQDVLAGLPSPAYRID